MNMIASAIKAAIGIVSAALMVGTAAAQAFPSRAVSLIVPYPAGGPSDAGARNLAPEYQKRLHQTVIVENVVGVSGASGVQRVLDAPPDGHTQLIGSPLELILTPLALAAVKHKPKDMRMAALYGSTSMVILVRKDAPVKTLDELVSWAKSGTLSAGNVGHGSLYHLAAVKFAQQAGATLNHAPYKGGAPLLNDLAGGHIDMAVVPFSGPVLGMVKESRFKAVGIAAPQPHPLLPDVPTVSSHPAFADFNFDVWAGVQVPRSTPDAVVERINRDVYDSMTEPEYRARLEANGGRVAPRRSVEELDRLYATEISRYQALAKSIGLEPQ
jgi:tripartite-type tricarboxylate transporter receptor subunit TctC